VDRIRAHLNVQQQDRHHDDVTNDKVDAGRWFVLMNRTSDGMMQQIDFTAAIPAATLPSRTSMDQGSRVDDENDQPITNFAVAFIDRQPLSFALDSSVQSDC